MATIKNLVLEQGATFSANIQYLNSNKVPISLAGYNVRSKMRTSYDAANAATFVTVITDAANGNINLSLTALDTGSLNYGRYVYDVEAYAGNIVLRVAEGTVNVTPGVSGAHLGSILNANVTTSDIPEGTNLYFTNARVGAAFSNFSGNIVPVTSNTYDLGSPTNRWKSLYLEATTINLGNVAISLDELTGNITFTDTTNANTEVTLIASTIQLGTGANAVVLGANTGALQTIFQPNSITGVEIADGSITLNKIGGLDTANVPESTNLYYTNARARSAFTAGANIYISPSGVISSLGGGGGNITLAGVATEANLELKANIIDLTTANVSETTGNLYYTNARVYSNVIGLLNLKANLIDLTTANVSESASNLYYTNARARLAIIAGTGVVYDNTTGNVSIGQNVATSASVTFANLTVTGITNFYGNVITHSSNNLSISDNMIYLNSGSDSSNPDLGIAGNYNDGTYHHAGFFRDATDGTWKVFDNYVPEPDANIFINTAHATFRLANLAATTYTGNVVGNVTGYVSSISNFTTTNLNEGSNLYYTNTRVYSNVSPLLALKANVVDLTTANVTESASNLYFTNARVYANVVSMLPTYLATYTGNLRAGNITTNAMITGSGAGGYITGANLISTNTISALNWSGLYTANVIETSGNLYFTNARARLAFTAGSNITIDANGVISSTGGSGGTGGPGSVTQANLTTSNVVELTNLYYTNARVYSNVISLLDAKANLTQLNTSNVTESISNLYYTNARVYANVIGLLNLKANVLDLTTANVFESTGNLYFTNARVYANVIGLLNLKANVVDFTTANTIESASNLYFTNARVYANVISLLNAKANLTQLNTSNVIESVSNLYYTNTRVYANVIGLLNAKANVTDLTTANVFETNSNLYYTNARVYSNVIGLFASYATIANLNLKANATQLTTANVSEITNLYFTNARVYANISPLLDAKAATSQLTTTNVAELTNLYYTNARVYSNVILLLGNKANVADLKTANIAESASNLYYTNARVYSNVINLLSNYATVANLNAKANASQLTTANVTELTNLYYTNARVHANLLSLLPVYNANIGAGNITIGTGVGGAVIGANLIQANNITVDNITIPNMSAFRVYGTGTTNITSGTTLNSTYATLDYNQTSSYATASGIFTAPTTGIYNVYLNARIGSTNGPSKIAVLKNDLATPGNIVCMWEIATSNASAQLFGVSTMVRLTAGQNLRAKVLLGSVTFDSNCNWGAAFAG